LGDDPLSNFGRQRAAGHFEIVVRLQILPELGSRAEEEPEAQRRIRGDAAAFVDDLGDAVRRNVQRPR
jgi:hypothetical protein